MSKNLDKILFPFLEKIDADKENKNEWNSIYERMNDYFSFLYGRLVGLWNEQRVIDYYLTLW